MANPAENMHYSGAVLKDSFHILKDKPLLHLNSGGIEAFDVESLKVEHTGTSFFALLSDPNLLPRYHIVAMQERLRSPYALRFVDWGGVQWHEQDEKFRAVFVYEKPAGERLCQGVHDKIEPVHESIVLKGILTPLFHALSKYDEQKLTYRALRPSNLFWTDDSKKAVQLGDCLTSPPAFFQDAAFEPIESAMASPTARGNGHASDDMYALGVTLAYALTGKSTFAGKTDEEVIQIKLEQGSYTSMLSGVRMAAALEEVIRGLLKDDPKVRWTPDHLAQWIDDRKSPVGSVNVVSRLAIRSYAYNGQDFRNLRLLVWEFYKTGTKAVFDITSVGFRNWLIRSCSLETMAEEIKELQEHLVEFYDMSLDPSHADAHKVLIKMCSHIEPYMPLFYKGFAFNVLGVGNALVSAQSDPRQRQLLAELVASGVIASGSDYQLVSPKGDDMSGFFKKLSGFLKVNEYGYSIERCLYDLNKFLFCQSDFIYNYYVFKPGLVLVALEQEAARREDLSDFPFDRHIAAFIATHGGNHAVPWVEGLNRQYTEEKKALAVLNFYAAIQEYYKIGPLPRLCEWFVGFMDFGLVKFHSRFQQERAEQMIRKKAREGSLVVLANIADNPQVKEADEVGYHNAKHLYLQLDAMEDNIDERLEKVVPESSRVANVISIVLAVILVVIFGCVTLFRYLG